MSEDKKTENHYHITTDKTEEKNDNGTGISCLMIILILLFLSALWDIAGSLAEVATQIQELKEMMK